MFVGASEEKRIESALPFIPRHNIGNDGRVQVAEMRQTVRIVDRCSYIERIRHLFDNMKLDNSSWRPKYKDTNDLTVRRPDIVY